MAKRKLGYFFYNTFLALAGLILSPFIIFQIITGFAAVWTSLKKSKPLLSKPVFWIHAASEEQLTAINGILPELTLSFSGYQPVLTYTGKNASNAGKSLGSDLMFVVLPYSVEFCASKILAQFKPQLVLMIEDPFHPNLVRHCKAAGVKVALIGGRVNHRLSLVYRLAPQFLKSVFQGIDLLIMDSVAEANRIGKLGAVLSTILVSGAVGCQVDAWRDDVKPVADDSLKETVEVIVTLLGRGF